MGGNVITKEEALNAGLKIEIHDIDGELVECVFVDEEMVILDQVSKQIST